MIDIIDGYDIDLKSGWYVVDSDTTVDGVSAATIVAAGGPNYSVGQIVIIKHDGNFQVTDDYRFIAIPEHNIVGTLTREEPRWEHSLA